MHRYFQASSEDTFSILAINLLFLFIDFCIARPIRFVVGLALNTYDDDDADGAQLTEPHR